MKRLLLPYLTVLFAMFFVVFPGNLQAAGSLYLTPSAKSVPQGANFTVTVGVNTQGEPVNAVQANLSYPADKLDFVGVSAYGSAFEIQAEGSGGGGIVRIGRGTVSGKSGSLTVGNVTFRAKANSGSATVSFAGGSSVLRSTDNANIFGGGGGGTYSFGPPSAQSSPVLGQGTGGSINIKDVKVGDIGLSTASVSWKTDVPATSLVEYGPSEKLGVTVSDTALLTEHKLILDSKLLMPGTEYFYQIKDKDEAGNESVGVLAKFRTKGFPVTIKLQSTNGKWLDNTKILLFSDKLEIVTDKDGVAQFADVAPGIHSVHVVVGRQTLAFEIEVKENAAEAVKAQEFTINIPASVILSQALITYAVIIGGGLVLIVGICLIIWRFKLRKKQMQDVSS